MLMLSYIVCISAAPATGGNIGGQAGKDPGQTDSRTSKTKTYSTSATKAQLEAEQTPVVGQLFKESKVVEKELKELDKELRKLEKEDKKIKKEEKQLMMDLEQEGQGGQQHG